MNLSQTYAYTTNLYKQDKDLATCDSKKSNKPKHTKLYTKIKRDMEREVSHHIYNDSMHSSSLTLNTISNGKSLKFFGFLNYTHKIYTMFLMQQMITNNTEN